MALVLAASPYEAAMIAMDGANANAPPTPCRARMTSSTATVGALIGYGFSVENAFLAVDTVFDLAIDVFSRGRQLDAAVGGSNVRDSTAQAWAEAVGPEVAPVMRQALADPAATWFDRKLKLVLDGIAAGLAPT
ncbi:hypothetical protein GCM10020220_042010 [Nonomuraea rubra]